MAEKKNGAGKAGKGGAGDGAATKGGPKSKTKSEVYKTLAEATGVKPREVATFFEKLQELIKKELGKKGPGVMTIPGLVKLQRLSKKATKAGQRPNPFKPGEMMEVKAKPARTVVKVRPLKNLKDLVGG
jgi:nucleoid DNA-binding protein